MPIKFNLNKTQHAGPKQSFSVQSVELMKAIQVREQVKGSRVTQPGEVFAILLGMGYKRDDQMDIQAQAREFVGRVRSQSKGKQSPSYDQIIATMKQLGYSRAVAA